MHFFLIITVAGQLIGSSGPFSRPECEGVKGKTVVTQAYREQVSLTCERYNQQPGIEQ